MPSHSTNYHGTLITVSEDSTRTHSVVPDRPGTVAALQYEMLTAAPYTMTSDDLLWRVEVRRNGYPDSAAVRQSWFAQPRPCLRASPLVKSWGWGIHHDADGCIALVGMETPEYARLLADASVRKLPGMRSTRTGRGGASTTSVPC